MLQDLCDNICNAAADAHCDGLLLNQCLSSCYQFTAAAEQSAQCANTTYAFLTCVNALPNICDLNDDTVCGSDTVVSCIVAYCQAHPGTMECGAIRGQQ